MHGQQPEDAAGGPGGEPTRRRGVPGGRGALVAVDPPRRMVVPFAVLIVVAQLSVLRPGGLTDAGAFWASTALLAAIPVVRLVSGARAFHSVFARGLAYLVVVYLLNRAAGPSSGLAVLVMVPILAVALAGTRRQVAVTLALALVTLLAIDLASHLTPVVLVRRMVLSGGLAVLIGLTLVLMRERLLASRQAALLLVAQAEVMNRAARRFAVLTRPDAIVRLGVDLVAEIGAVPGVPPPTGSYLAVEGDVATTVDGGLPPGAWRIADHPLLADAVRGRCPTSGSLEDLAPDLASGCRALGLSHGAWVPVRAGDDLHGVLAVLTRGTPVPPSAFERSVALGHLMELALSNWRAHEHLEAEATARERRRLARELHDGLAHELAFIASRSSSYASDDQGARAQIADAAGRALDEARRAITVLTEESSQPLHRMLAHTAEDAAARYGVRIVLDLDERAAVDAEVAEQLLRVVREAIANAVRHGQAARVAVGSAAGGGDDGGVRLWVADDGCGFDPGSVRSGGFGLRSMRERCALVGGTLEVCSAPGRGTRIEVVLR